MMMYVCEKEVCLLCAGYECERRGKGEREVRLRELSENSWRRERTIISKFQVVSSAPFCYFPAFLGFSVRRVSPPCIHGEKACGKWYECNKYFFDMLGKWDGLHIIHSFMVLFQVLGIPWDVDTNGLKEYMIKFGELEDCIVMKVSNASFFLLYLALSFVNTTLHVVCFRV